MAELLDRVRAALAAPADLPTAALNDLNQACGREHCNRRARILHQLRQFLTLHTTPMAAPSTTHKFKRDFAKAKAIIEVDGKTKAVTGDNLTDEDVPLLQQYGYGHLLEALPQAAAASGDDEDGDDSHGDAPRTAESLGKLKKGALQKLHSELIGPVPSADTTRAELIAAILAADTEKE